MRLFQNRQSGSDVRHPAWRPERGFPKAPDSIATTSEAKQYLADGLRVYVVRTEGDDYYAGFLVGGYPADWPDNGDLRALFTGPGGVKQFAHGLYLEPADQASPFHTEAGGTVVTRGDLRPLPGEAPEVAYAQESADEAAGKPPSRTGAGYRTNAAEIRAIEQHAVRVARQHYEKSGWKVKELGKPYDLEIKRGGATLHVEVKGTTSNGASVVLTYNEVQHHMRRRPENAIVIVRGIDIDPGTSPPTASGGTLYERADWSIDQDRLQPISYKYTIPPDIYDQPGIPADQILES